MASLTGRIAKEFLKGRVVPFLGAGAGLAGRGSQAGAQLPSGAELAHDLALESGYPGKDTEDLIRVAQYMNITLGSGPLYEELRDRFDRDYPPNSVHRLLASLPKWQQAGGRARDPYPLIVTTNYDDSLDRALAMEGEDFDEVTYVATRGNRGKFRHRTFIGGEPSGDDVIIDLPNEYSGIELGKRTVLLKLHGAVDRVDPDSDSFVVTEDDYLEYMSSNNMSDLIPTTLAAALQTRHILFLGYSLRDWNLRVILRRLWGERNLEYQGWAIQREADPLDVKSWGPRNVEVVVQDLNVFTAELSVEMGKLSAGPAGGGGVTS